MMQHRESGESTSTDTYYPVYVIKVLWQQCKILLYTIIGVLTFGHEDKLKRFIYTLVDVTFSVRLQLNFLLRQKYLDDQATKRTNNDPEKIAGPEVILGKPETTFQQPSVLLPSQSPAGCENPPNFCSLNPDPSNDAKDDFLEDCVANATSVLLQTIHNTPVTSCIEDHFLVAPRSTTPELEHQCDVALETSMDSVSPAHPSPGSSSVSLTSSIWNDTSDLHFCSGSDTLFVRPQWQSYSLMPGYQKQLGPFYRGIRLPVRK